MKLNRTILVLPILLCQAMHAQSPDLDATVADFAQKMNLALKADDLPEAYRQSVWLSAAISKEMKSRKPTPLEKLSQLKTAFASKGTGFDPLYRLIDIPRAAWEAEQYYEAEQYATLLLNTASEHRTDQFFGNAEFEGNSVKGRAMLRRGDIAGATEALAASTSGAGTSAVLKSFGPKMDLAQELLQAGSRDAVIEFLLACKIFWKMDRGQLDLWIATIRGGAIPRLNGIFR